MCVPRRLRARGANWSRTQVAHTWRKLGKHAGGRNWPGVCATQVAHTWRKLGEHAGGATDPCVCHAGGANMAQTKAARRWDTCSHARQRARRTRAARLGRGGLEGGLLAHVRTNAGSWLILSAPERTAFPAPTECLDARARDTLADHCCLEFGTPSTRSPSRSHGPG